MAEPRIEGRVIETRWAELVVALLFLLAGLVAIVDSLRVGITWAEDGPRAGYFPFYIGCLLAAASAWIAITALRRWKALEGDVFVSWANLVPVMKVFVPTLVYVFVIGLLGIYVASAIYITGFMLWQGRFKILPALAAGILIPVAIFLLFEVWFLIPLPKGPLEQLLGY